MKIIVRALMAQLLFTAVATATDIDWTRPEPVVAAAVNASPILKRTASEVEAARERVTSAGSLPNPMVMGGVQNQQIDLSIDRMMTMYMVGVSQTLTRGDRRNALRTAAELEVRRLEQQYESERAEVEREVRLAWYDAAAAQSEIDSTDEIARLAKTTADAARIRYENGLSPQSDMIRAMLQESEIRHDLLSLRGRRQQAIANLVALLNLPANSDIPPFGLGHQHEVQGSETSLPETTPAIAELQTEVAGTEEEIKLAKLARKPDWNVEASYGLRPYEKDMLSVVARIELPYRKSTIIEPRIREAMARRDAAMHQIDILRQQLRQDFGRAAALRDEARQQIALHVDQLVPAAKLGFESSLASYQSGQTTLESVLGSLQSYLTLNVDYFEFLNQERQAEADIEAIRKGARSGMATARGMR